MASNNQGERKNSLGGSLAHGMSKREYRANFAELEQKIEKITLYRSRYAPTKSRAACYRNEIFELRQLAQGHVIKETVKGDIRGKDKKSSFEIIFWVADDNLFLIYGGWVDSRHPERSELWCIASMTSHAIARIYQTFNLNSLDVFFQEQTDLSNEILAIHHAAIESEKGDYSEEDRLSELTFAIIFDEGVLLALYDFLQHELEIKTAISFESMSLKRKELVQQYFCDNGRLMIWKRSGDEW